MSKFRWMRSKDFGLTLQHWHKYRAMPVGTSFYDWRSVADVFKARRGDRWVIRVATDRHKNYRLIYDQYTAHSLREAMRLAKFMVGVNHGS